MAGNFYRALIKHGGGPSGGQAMLHLIREDAESSLCGLPRTSLGQAEVYDQIVCDSCIEWLHERGRVTGITSRAEIDKLLKGE